MANDRIGWLRYDLGANTATLKTDLKRARGMNKKYARDTKKLFRESRRHINSMGRALVTTGAAGGAAMAALTHQSLQASKALVANAENAGQNVEAFQELRYAASQYQVTQEALTDGLKEMSLRADEFATTGGGSAAEAFKRIGFSQQEVNEGLKDSDKLFMEVASRIQELDRAAQIRVADEIFGGQGGEQFVRWIRAGVSEMARMRAEAREMGLVLDEELLRNAEDASRQMDVLGKVVSVNVTSAILQLSPLIQALSQQIREDLTGAVNGAEKSSDQFLEGTVEGLQTAAKVLGVFLDGWRGIEVGIKTGELALAGLRGTFVLIFEALNRVMVAFQKDWNYFIAQPIKRAGEILGKDWDFTVDVNTTTDFDKLMQYATEDIKEVRGELHDLMMEELPSEGLKRSLQGVLDKLERIQEESKKASEAGTSAGGGSLPEIENPKGQPGGEEDLTEAEKAMQRYRESVLDAQRSSDLFLEKQALLDRMFQKGKISAEVYNAELKRMEGGFEDAADKGEEMASDLENAITGWASNFSRQLNDILWEADTTFSDIARSFAKMITQMVIQKKVVEPMLSSIDLSGFAQGGAFAGGVQRFARGGVVNSPKLFPMAQGMGLMGEAGPEAVMPLTRLPGGDLGVQAAGAGAGGGGVSVVVENHGQPMQVTGTERRQGPGGEQQIRVLVENEVKRMTGDGSLDRPLAQNYGLRRRGGGR